MAGNSFGQLFTVTTFGESHGKADVPKPNYRNALSHDSTT